MRGYRKEQTELQSRRGVAPKDALVSASAVCHLCSVELELLYRRATPHSDGVAPCTAMFREIVSEHLRSGSFEESSRETLAQGGAWAAVASLATELGFQQASADCGVNNSEGMRTSARERQR